ncbi:MAG: hypothetical protein VXW65_01970, partial [Pseudomonadota bacterium]|nr:hypothetical protein [Pseudomonadota bacterium]
MDDIVQLDHIPMMSKNVHHEEKRVTPTVMERLMDEIIQLGHVPRRAKTASAEEKKLAQRLWYARTVGSLTREQQAAL